MISDHLRLLVPRLTSGWNHRNAEARRTRRGPLRVQSGKRNQTADGRGWACQNCVQNWVSETRSRFLLRIAGGTGGELRLRGGRARRRKRDAFVGGWLAVGWPLYRVAWWPVFRLSFGLPKGLGSLGCAGCRRCRGFQDMRSHGELSLVLAGPQGLLARPAACETSVTLCSPSNPAQPIQPNQWPPYPNTQPSLPTPVPRPICGGAWRSSASA